MAGINLDALIERASQAMYLEGLSEQNKRIVAASSSYLKTIQSDYQLIENYNNFLKVQNAYNKMEKNKSLLEIQSTGQELGKRDKILSDKQLKRYERIVSPYTSLNEAKNQLINEVKIEEVKLAFTRLTVATSQYQKEMLSAKNAIMQTVFAINVVDKVFVFEEQYELTNENADKIFHMDIGSDGGGLVARYNTSMSALESMYKKTEYTTNGNNENHNYLTQAYLKLLERAEATKSTNNSKIFIPYKNGNEKKVAQISARGDIAEAYLKLLLNNSNTNKQYSNIDDAILDILVSTEEVTNLSGMFKGDFEKINGDQTTEIAAKSLGASLMGYKQMVTFAKKTLSALGNDSANQKINKAIQNKSSGGGKRNSLNVQINDAIEEAVRREIEKLLKEL